MTYKGIILAGGAGTRLHPATAVISKQLLPVFDKPMVYYPLCTFMLADIRDILIISTPQDTPRYQQLFGTGEQFGINIEYAVQPEPRGLPQAFIIGESFIGHDRAALILGDNIFHGDNMRQLSHNAMQRSEGATVFAYHAHDPERYGVVEFDAHGKAISLEEKPVRPKSQYAITGLYFYDENVINYAKELRPSARNELEITDLNRIYLQQNKLHVETMGREFAWFDMGTHQSLLNASQFIATLQTRQNLILASPEEIAYRKKWITAEQLSALAQPLLKNSYGQYLNKLLTESVS